MSRHCLSYLLFFTPPCLFLTASDPPPIATVQSSSSSASSAAVELPVFHPVHDLRVSDMELVDAWSELELADSLLASSHAHACPLLPQHLALLDQARCGRMDGR